jgi:site-specific recombinase XerD
MKKYNPSSVSAINPARRSNSSQVAPAVMTDPELLALGKNEKAVRALLHEGNSPQTLRSYRSAIRYWMAWHEQRLACSLTLPLPIRTILLFITDHIEHMTPHQGLAYELPHEVEVALVSAGVKRRFGPLALATVQHRLAVLSEAHQAQGLESPCCSRAVQILIARTRSAYARRGVRSARQAALTREPLAQLLATCDQSLIGIRDRALLLFAWASGGRRRSEIVSATVENLQRLPDGFLYALAYSKTHRDGAEHAHMYKPIVGPAADALDAWLQRGLITQGAIFRRIRRGGVVGGALNAETVRRIVKNRCAQAGLVGAYAAHSLRSGFVTEAGRQGVPLAEVMAMTGHTSVHSVVAYHRIGEASTLRGARLLTPEEFQGKK